MNQYVTVNGGTSLYDQNFNLYTLNGWRYDYDADKHLLLTTNGSSTATFLYDGLGRCVRRTINGTTTRFIYDGWKPFMEWSQDTGHFVAWNIYGRGPDEILWRWDEAVGHLRYHHDAHGNVTSLLDYGGNVIEKYTYDAFGKPTVTDWWGNPHVSAGNEPQSWYGNRFMFQGREWIAELGIYDYRHRMYNPDLGRFLQTDPMGLQTEGAKLTPEQKALFGAGAPEAFGSSEMNLYRYCGDDPVDGSDPLGLEVQASLEYYIMDGALGRGHMNFVLYDTTTGQTMIGRGMPSEPYGQSALRSLLDRAQPSKSGMGNVKLKMDVKPGTKGVDNLTGNKTTTVPGSVTTVGDDMKAATSKLNQVAAQMNDKQLDYRLQSVNSNSAAGTAYNYVTGRSAPETPQCPGANLNILTGNELRPPPRELTK